MTVSNNNYHIWSFLRHANPQTKAGQEAIEAVTESDSFHAAVEKAINDLPSSFPSHVRWMLQKLDAESDEFDEALSEISDRNMADFIEDMATALECLYYDYIRGPIAAGMIEDILTKATEVSRERGTAYRRMIGAEPISYC